MKPETAKFLVPILLVLLVGLGAFTIAAWEARRGSTVGVPAVAEEIR